jgi:glycosyltransferase involved in cell wall biosynthesis
MVVAIMARSRLSKALRMLPRVMIETSTNRLKRIANAPGSALQSQDRVQQLEVLERRRICSEKSSPAKTLETCVNLRTLGYRITGVQRYLLSLLPHMPAELDPLKPSRALQGIKGHLWEQLYLPTQLKRRLLWSPGNTGPIGVSQQVLTVHDAASLDHPEWFERKFALWYAVMLPRLIRKVRAIITVSHFSKERIVRLTGAEPERVHIIYNGVDQRFRPADPDIVKRVRTNFNLTSPYILFVGSLEPRKNLKMLLEAWQLGGFDAATLAVVGASGHLFPKLQFGSIPDGVRLLGPVEDDVLPALYSGAAGFVYPSVYEGFGLPPLEAMACGCPVAVSDIPAHREVCGGTAMYFDPFVPEDISAKLQSLSRLDGASRASLVENGLRHAALYNWQEAASETWRVLKLAAAG